MVKSFETKQRERKVTEFELDGETFTFTHPKKASLIMSVVEEGGLDKNTTDSDSIRDLLNWLGEGLSEEQGDKILARLRDPQDDFDLPDVNDIARHLLAQTSNRPTRRRFAS
jgi:hypothetical protein